MNDERWGKEVRLRRYAGRKGRGRRIGLRMVKTPVKSVQAVYPGVKGRGGWGKAGFRFRGRRSGGKV